ncbi:MAG: HlyD family efflux transporter periplasmic adaptor subunit [Deltaproteobacteria bacterium]|nr:HlyD family efflux transporter periplasmic adaptor subunit [Deltaproteobacteria bacterium]
MRNRGLLTLTLLGWLLCGASSSPPPASSSSPSAKDVAPPEAGNPDLFTGFLVAANATDLFSPMTSFRVRGWNSNWGTIKLLQLAPDGSEVKAGEVVARFEFIGRDAQNWINERIQKAEAEASQSRISSAQRQESLLMEKRRKELEARQAGLDVQREKAISRRQAELFKIRRKIADFEVEAVAARIEGTRASIAAENAWQDLNVQSVHDDQKRYAFYEKNFALLAPHDGVVRHAFNSNERRKVQKGDAFQAGSRVVSLAKDGTLAAKFFVPEHRIAEIQVGARIAVTTSASATEHRATVKKIDFFPQELAFLMESPNLPNGQEKAFAVTAQLDEAPAGLTAGTEIKVKAAAPAGAGGGR